MKKISVHNEWDPLKRVILGTIDQARVPTIKDKSLHCINYPHHSHEVFLKMPSGYYPDYVLEETREDLEVLAEQLENFGIEVLRPQMIDTSEIEGNGHWSVDGYYTYCPRDTIVAIGDKVIASPMVLRHRQHEYKAYKNLIPSENWFEAPRPQLTDDMYDRTNFSNPTLMNDEPAFDAANILKCNDDLIFLISNTGNERDGLEIC